MKVIKEISAIQNISDYYKCIGKKVGLVPTMGYLHAGHSSLMNRAKKENEILVVSIFVNPAQFGKNEDFDKYPRDFARDYKVCEEAGADYIFNPEIKEMYGDNQYVSLTVKEISEKLEGKFRPGHFNGVATIVAKLLNAVKPVSLYLGQKDAQQNVIINKLITDLNYDIEVVICETIRENSGLAMSSRNSYLSREDKDLASALFFVLNEGKRLIMKENVIDSNEIKGYICRVISEKAPGFKLEYYEITDTERLEELKDIGNYQGNILISLSAKAGDVRLIDNISFKK